MTEEPRLVGNDGRNYLPDLVLSAGAGEPCYVIDPTVVWDDNPRKLKAAWRGKVQKYAPIKPAVEAMFQPSSVETFRFVCGAKGTWCSLNDNIAKTVGLKKKNSGITRILQKVLWNTIKMVKAFMAR